MTLRNSLLFYFLKLGFTPHKSDQLQENGNKNKKHIRTLTR